MILHANSGSEGTGTAGVPPAMSAKREQEILQETKSQDPRSVLVAVQGVH